MGIWGTGQRTPRPISPTPKPWPCSRTHGPSPHQVHSDPSRGPSADGEDHGLRSSLQSPRLCPVPRTVPPRAAFLLVLSLQDSSPPRRVSERSVQRALERDKVAMWAGPRGPLRWLDMRSCERWSCWGLSSRPAGDGASGDASWLGRATVWASRLPSPRSLTDGAGHAFPPHFCLRLWKSQQDYLFCC